MSGNSSKVPLQTSSQLHGRSIPVVLLRLFHAVLRFVTRVWRMVLPSLQNLEGVFHRRLLSLRFEIRSFFPKKRNEFAGFQARDVPVIVINLVRRKDRLRDVVDNLNRVGFRDVRILEAVDGPATYPELLRGHAANLGCTQSHMAAVLDNLNDLHPIAVCEDDNEFIEQPEKIFELIESFLETPNYDVLCLSSRTRGPKISVSPEFHLVTWAMAPAFYILKPRAKNKVLASYRTSIRRLKEQRRKGPFDQVWRKTQRYSLFFVRPKTKVARQKESHSDIQGRFFEGT